MSISFDPARHADMVDVLARAAAPVEDVLAALDREVRALYWVIAKRCAGNHRAGRPCNA